MNNTELLRLLRDILVYLDACAAQEKDDSEQLAAELRDFLKEEEPAPPQRGAGCEVCGKHGHKWQRCPELLPF